MQQGIVIHAPHDLRVQELETAELQPHQLKVKVKAGGICGSDLHYYHNGGFGTVRIKEPMVLGHEVSGVIAETGSAIGDIKPGTRISISPSNPCGLCKYCQEGKHNHCLDMRFYGSAMRMPHVQGAFRQEIIIERAQAHVVADHVTDGEAAMAEPLSVALHAVRRAGPLFGKRVLVTGCGPIGALTVIAARRAGALQIVVTQGFHARQGHLRCAVRSQRQRASLTRCARYVASRRGDRAGRSGRRYQLPGEFVGR